MALTDRQLIELRQLAQRAQQTGEPVYGHLMALADDWDVPYAVVARDYLAFVPTKETRPRSNSLGAPVPRPQPAAAAGTQNRPQPAAAAVAQVRRGEPAPTMGIRATPGLMATQSTNWVLVQARLLDPPLAVSAYKRIEAGSQLPTPDHAAQLCLLFDLDIAETFVLAGPPVEDRSLRGLSMVGVLRARRRWTMQQLRTEVATRTGVNIPQVTLSRIERGALTERTMPTDAEVQALAKTLEIPAAWVLRELPAEMVRLAASQTRVLHESLRSQTRAMPALEPEQAHLLPAGGGTTLL